MRKFTKEITALIASVAVTAAVGTASATSEEIVETAGVDAEPTEIVETAGVALPTDCTEPTLPPVDGGLMPSDDYTDPTEEFPPLAGDPLPPDEYIEPTEEFPPLAGDPLPPDEYIEPTEEFPPLAGEPLPSDEYIETTEEISPIVGDVSLPDGDVDGNGSFNIADVVSFSKYLLNKSDEVPDNLYAADLCTDGKINILDLVIMKREMIKQNTTELSENDYDYTLLEKYDNLTEYKDGAQISVYTQNDEALVMWKIPVLYEMDGCEQTITSIDSCTYKSNDLNIIDIVKSDNVYYYSESPKGYSYCVIKSLKEGDATLILDCESGEKYIEFSIDNDLNISIKD